MYHYVARPYSAARALQEPKQKMRGCQERNPEPENTENSGTPTYHETYETWKHAPYTMSACASHSYCRGKPLRLCITPVQLCCGAHRSLFSCTVVCVSYSRPFADMGLDSGSVSAFVHPRLSGLASAQRAPHHRVHHSQSRATFSLHAECESTPHRTRWPWVFEQPGRCIDLPAEEIFAGFDGLDGFAFDDGFNDQTDASTDDLNDVNSSLDQSKVTREVRNACHSPVCLDPAPAAKVVVLSQTGAALTGIPRDARCSGIGGEEEQHDLVDLIESGENVGKVLSHPELKELAPALTGTRLLLGSQPFASCYGGHQFGNWAGQLGDGRVATLGEIRAGGDRNGVAGVAAAWDGHLIEIQLKGIGKTPYSRSGDGKAVLGACLREYLFSEAFIGLGLAAAVAVSVCSTGQYSMITASDAQGRGTVKRAPGAVLCRAAPSFLRFGSFELPARRGEMTVVRRLADFCLRHLGPHLELPQSTGATGAELQHPTEAFGKEVDRYPTAVDSAEQGHVDWPPPEDGLTRAAENEGKGDVDSKNDYLVLLVAIVEATADMVAGWQALGFCHGVLNTDNFTLLGLALDFGPCSFMEKYEPAWSPNEGDSALRYTFQNQPDVSAWNCERLTEAFSSLVGVSGVAEADKAFSPAFDSTYTAHLQRKFGLTGMELGSGWVDLLRDGGASSCETKAELSSDAQFVLRFFGLMATCGTDFTDTWRALLHVPALSTVPPKKTGLENVGLKEEGIAGRQASTYGGLDGAGTRVSGKHRNGDSTSEGCCTRDGVESEVTDEEVLRPLVKVLKAAGVSSDRMTGWAKWLREYMGRIDTQGVGRSHPEGEEEGRRERLQTMQTSNPAFVLRPASLEQAIDKAQDGDMMLVHQLQERLSRPYAMEDLGPPTDNHGR